MDFKEIFGSNKPRCQHFKEDGSRCKTDPQTGKKFCFMHDPGQKEKQTEARRKGGEVRAQLYPRKVPPTFHYKAPQDHYEVKALLDQIALYYTQDEMDLRSARFYCYIAIGTLAIWNSLDRRQSKAARDAENQARILRREKDPWSPHYGVLARAKAKEEAEKAAKAEANPATNNNETNAMPSDVALSFRELEELKQEEERKEKERERTRQKLSHWNENQNEDQNEDRKQNEYTKPGPTILDALKMSFSGMLGRANRARDRERVEHVPETESTVSKSASESTPPKRPPQPVPPAPAGRGAGRGSARNNEDEQRQQRIMQSDMNELTERVAEQVRAEAYKKGEWRRKRRW